MPARISKNKEHSNVLDLGSLFSVPNRPYDEHVPELKSQLPKKAKVKDESWKDDENQRPMRSNNRRWQESSQSGSFLSAGESNHGDGAISDFGGPRKSMGMDSSNSIWASGHLDELVKQAQEEKQSQTAKQARDIMRKNWKQERMDSVYEGLSKTDNRKSSTVLSMSNEASNGKSKYSSERNASVFDSYNDKETFGYVAKMTHGEKVAQNAKQIKEERDEMRKKARLENEPKNTLNMQNNFFEKIASEPKQEKENIDDREIRKSILKKVRKNA